MCDTNPEKQKRNNERVPDNKGVNVLAVITSSQSDVDDPLEAAPSAASTHPLHQWIYPKSSMVGMLS